MDYNIGSMKSTTQSKNISYLGGQKFHKRWTILDVNADVVDLVKEYASENRMSVGGALEKMFDHKIRERKKAQELKLKIGIDYWQVISHYTDYFKDFSRRMLDAGHEVHIITAVGKDRANDVFGHIDLTGVPYTKKHKVIFKNPSESPELKLALCQKLGINVFYDDRDDVCRELNKHNIIAMRVTRKDNSTYDLGAEIK